MADLTDAQLAYIRSEVGSDTPSEDELNEVYARLGTPEEVVAELLRTRLADMIADSGSLTIPGAIALGGPSSEAIKALAARVDRAESAATAADTGTPAKIGVGRITRVDRVGGR